MRVFVEALIVVLAGLFFGLPLNLVFALFLLWAILKKGLSGKKPILAFDYGGVLMQGDYFTEKVRVNPEMKSLVSRLRKKYKTVTLTNDNSKAFPHLSRELNTEKLFEKDYISSDIGFQKPDKRFYLHVLRDLNSSPQEVVYVDDKLENVQSASKLGINSIHFRSKEQLVKDLARYGIST